MIPRRAFSVVNATITLMRCQNPCFQIDAILVCIGMRTRKMQLMMNMLLRFPSFSTCVLSVLGHDCETYRITPKRYQAYINNHGAEKEGEQLLNHQSF